MSVFGKRGDPSTASLLQEAERARARGALEKAQLLIREAALLLVENKRVDEAIDLCLTERDYAFAAEIAEKARDWKRAAQLWFRGGDFVRAAKARLEGGEPMMAAELYERVGDFAGAAGIYEQQQDFLRASSVFEKAGDKQRAADLLVRAISSGNGRVFGAEADEACRRAGVLYAEIGLLDMAVRVLRYGQQNVFAGKLLARAGRHEEAIQLLSASGDYLAAAELARASGNEKRAHLLLGERAEKEGRYSEAALHFDQADLYARAARLYEYADDLPRAAEMHERGQQFDMAAELYSQLALFADAARCLRAMGREAEASALEERAGSHEDQIFALAARGDFMAAAEGAIALARSRDPSRYQEAASYLQRIGVDHPEWLRARTLLAEVLVEQGDTRAAIALLGSALHGATFLRSHVPALYQYGRLLELEGYLAQARHAYRAALALEPSFRDLADRVVMLGEVEPPPAPVPSRVPQLRTVTGVPVRAPSPRANTPMPHAPMPHAQLSSAPMPHAQLSSAPLPHAQLSSAPLPRSHTPSMPSMLANVPVAPMVVLPAMVSQSSNTTPSSPNIPAQAPLTSQSGSFASPLASQSGSFSNLPASQSGSFSNLPGSQSGSFSNMAASGSFSNLPASQSGSFSNLPASQSGSFSNSPASGSFSNSPASGSFSSPVASQSGSFSNMAASGSFSNLPANAQLASPSTSSSFANLPAMPLGSTSSPSFASATPLPPYGSTSTSYANLPAITPPTSTSSASFAALPPVSPLASISSPSAPATPATPPPKEQEVARPANMVGVVLRGRFRIEGKLGRGAQAEVYRARDLVLDRPVAIKVLSESIAQDKAALERFLREARLAARVNHASCISIYDFGQEHGITFMAMEYFKGKTLRDRIGESPLDPLVALSIARDVAEALGAVHAAGIVHRDIKPTNVMVDEQGRARLTDFGVAKDAGEEAAAGVMIGTLRYMSPEQARGKDVDARADIFSLGVVLYEMLAGRAPFGGTLDALIKRVKEPPPALPPALQVPELVRSIVLRCLQKKREGRYPNVEPLVIQLKAALEETRALLAAAPQPPALTPLLVGKPPPPPLPPPDPEDQISADL